jgi:hypothetical protein
MNKEILIEKLNGNYIQVTSGWVKIHDENLYIWMTEKLKKWTEDPYNSTTQDDLCNFVAGNWLIEYHFDSTKYWYCAGENEYALANQCEWGYDQYDDIDIDMLQKFANLIHS